VNKSIICTLAFHLPCRIWSMMRLTDLSVLDRAGGYGIQALGGMLAEYVSGDFLNMTAQRLHGYILHCNDMVWPLFSHLENAVREGTSQHERAFGKKNEDVFQDAYYSKDEVKIRFMDAMHSIARLTGKDVATAFDLSPYKTACDIGGCTGAMAYEFTKAHPGLSVIVFDLPQVIEMRRDFFKDDQPKADLYILARILHDWSDEKLHVLLSKLSKMSTPGCGLLVSEIFLDEERKRPSRALLQALSMTEGKQRSTTEYRDLLEKHGFTPKHIKHTDNLLDAIKLLIS
uniref:Acetylserotonin O-methyltransferase n=1 Tax=Sinocyclocheilus anshuiensis TaxID=1608454 RepID=A0A671NR11_9TELE